MCLVRISFAHGAQSILRTNGESIRSFPMPVGTRVARPCAREFSGFHLEGKLGNRDKWEGRIRPAAQAYLEPIDKASRGLSRVGPSVCLQALKAEVWILVHETAVFRAQRKVARQNVVSASAVQERASRLRVRAGHKSAAVTCRMKDQAPASSQRVRNELTDVKRQVHNHIASNAMNVRLDSGLSRI